MQLRQHNKFTSQQPKYTSKHKMHSMETSRHKIP